MKTSPWKKESVAVMGILNLSPDSFSDPHPEAANAERAVERARQLLHDGAHILDIGAVSTKPGFSEVSVHEEERRLMPGLLAVRLAFPEAYLSVDLHHEELAADVLAAGCDMLNLYGGLSRMPIVVSALRAYPVPVAVYHDGTRLPGESAVQAVARFFEEERGLWAREAFPEENFVFDPGFGFHKDVQENIALLRALPQFAPSTLLVGLSRKRHLAVLSGDATMVLPAHLAEIAFAVERGAKIVRVHDAKEVSAFLRVFNHLQGESL